MVHCFCPNCGKFDLLASLADRVLFFPDAVRIVCAGCESEYTWRVTFTRQDDVAQTFGESGKSSK